MQQATTTKAIPDAKWRKEPLARQQKYESQIPRFRVGEAREKCNPDLCARRLNSVPDGSASCNGPDFCRKTYPDSNMGEFFVRPEIGENASAYRRMYQKYSLSPAEPAQRQHK